MKCFNLTSSWKLWPHSRSFWGFNFNSSTQRAHWFSFLTTVGVVAYSRVFSCCIDFASRTISLIVKPPSPFLRRLTSLISSSTLVLPNQENFYRKPQESKYFMFTLLVNKIYACRIMLMFKVEGMELQIMPRYVLQ